MVAAAITRATSDVGAPFGRTQNQLARIKKYMKDHLSDADLSLARISKDQNVSVRTLARLFADIGATPMGWLQSQRLSSAYSAIAEKKVESVTEAAFSFGFNDLSHFGRVFKKTYGHAPNKLLDHLKA